MRKSLPFVKMSGAGNDFVLLNAAAARRSRLTLPALARRLCDRRRGIGADGLLVVGRGSRPGALSLAYFNADGSRAFCANGTRCAAWWGHASGLVRGREVRLEAGRERLDARIEGPERVRLRMPEVRDVRLHLSVPVDGKPLTVHHLVTGVPHAVVFVPDVSLIPVEALGRKLRRHPMFQPAGANVNFAAVKGKGLTVRTYERGVEAETLACGTGVTACAVASCLLGKLRPPVACLTRGGDTLTVRFKMDGGSSGVVWLEGPARVTFEGKAYV